MLIEFEIEEMKNKLRILKYEEDPFPQEVLVQIKKLKLLKLWDIIKGKE